MKGNKNLLKDTGGYTLIEFIIIIAIFAITIMPVYKMIVSSAKIQKASEETYEATLQSQALLQSIKRQIEKDVEEEYNFKRNMPSPGIKPWLEPIDPSTFNESLIDFLSSFYDPKDFHRKFKTDTFLYEVHIWPLEKGVITNTPVSFTEDGKMTNPSDFTMVEINDAIKDYFDHQDSLLWTNLNSDLSKNLKAIGAITYDQKDGLMVMANGVSEGSPGLEIKEIDGYKKMPSAVKLRYENYDDNGLDITHHFTIEEDGVALSEDHIIQLSIDLTTFENPKDLNSKREIIKVENESTTKVILPIYNEINNPIKIFPIQKRTGGQILVDQRHKLEPSKNFVIGIIVKDALNSTFGEKNKILSKIVDVYSYDYNKIKGEGGNED